MARDEQAGLARFRRIVEAYGAQPRRWPEAERAWALSLLESSAEARAFRDQAAALDALLDQAEVTEASPELMADVLAAASPSAWRSWGSLLWPFGPLWQPAAGLALAALIGVMLGAAFPSPAEIAELTAEIDSLLLG